jgi:hypothetical protein
MTKEELAALLNGREYLQEISKEEAAQAAESGLVVIYGASDDLVELEGAIYDEAGCFDGGTIYLDAKGLIPGERDDDWDDEEMADYFARKPKAIRVEAVWSEYVPPCWTYQTDRPHATFEIVEDGEPYCRGIVIDLKE